MLVKLRSIITEKKCWFLSELKIKTSVFKYSLNQVSELYFHGQR